FPVALLRPLGHLSAPRPSLARPAAWWCSAGIPQPQRDSAYEAEGEGFEPSIRLTTDNGFRDRRIRPLCHPSSGEGGIRTLDAGIHPHNALAGRRLQPLGHFSGRDIVSAAFGVLR